jgi:hypothetical protein
MAEEPIVEVLRRAPLGFVGTIEHLGAATMKDVPIDDRTAVVFVDHVFHAPDAFANLQGHRVTLQLAKDKPPPQEGETMAWFTRGLAFGDGIAVEEVDRRPVEAMSPQLENADMMGPAAALSVLRDDVANAELRDHAATADAIVVGRVLRLEGTARATPSEHDPDWWKAVIDVAHVERGTVGTGELTVLYANSIDVRWRSAPKPRASQEGVWILHATTGDLQRFAPFRLVHPEDYQPVDKLEALRAIKG